jgi:thiol reductant ABC exporter CydD subunit
MSAGPVDRRLLRGAPAARVGVLAAVAVGVVGTGLIVAQAALLARVVAGSFDGAGLAALRGSLIGLGLVLLARAATGYAGEAVAGRVATDVKRQLRSRLLRHALDLGPGWLARHGPGELTTLATRGLDGLDGYLGRYLPQLVLAGLVPGTVLVVLGLADWPSALVVAVSLPLIVLVLALVGRAGQVASERQWGLLQRLGGHFLDVLEGLPTLLVFRRARSEVATIRRVTDEHRVATMRTLRIAFLSALLLEGLASIAVALVAVRVGLGLLHGQVPYRSALLVLLLAPEVYLPVRRVGAEYHAGREGSVAAGAAFEVLAEPVPATPGPAGAAGRAAAPTGLVAASRPAAGTGPAAASRPAAGTGPAVPGPAEPATAVPAPAVPMPAAAGPAVPGPVAGPAGPGGLHVDGLLLSYPDRALPALAGVSLRVPAGERLALLGASGAGKSSLFAVLLRFATPAAGHVTFDGFDLLGADPARARRRIAWLPQQPYLLAGTVAENVRLGRPAATAAELDEVAGLVGLDQVLRRLPGGWQAPVGERGQRLSAGQRQRLALARALLRDAPLVLLDEPTAHLDPESAAAVRLAVLARTAGRTLLVISHDADWPAAADRVVRLDAGRLLDDTSAFPSPRTPDPVPVVGR